MSDQTAVSISVKWCPVHSLVLLCLYLDGLFFKLKKSGYGHL